MVAKLIGTGVAAVGLGLYTLTLLALPIMGVVALGMWMCS